MISGDVQMSFERLLDVLPDAALAVDDAGQIVLANHQAASLFGYERASLIGRPIEALVPDRFRDGHPAHRADYATSPRTRPMGAGLALYGCRHDGSEFPAEVMLSTIAVGDDSIVVAAVRDISDRTGQRARARLAAVVESSADAILAKDRDGLVTDWNAAATRLYGFSREEMVGRPVTRIIPPDRREETEATVAAVLAGQVVAPYDTVRVSKDGERLAVSVSISAIRDEHGNVTGASTIARDIREQLRAEADRSHAHAVFENSVDAIIALDLDGLVTAWSPAATRLFGYTAEEALGRPSVALVASDEDETTRRAVVAEVLAGRSNVLNVRRRGRDGRMLSLSVGVSPLKAPDGAITGIVSIVRDVTAVVQAETRARAAAAREVELLDELHQTRRLESIGQLAGGVAHDFNNLLGVIINYAQFVIDDLPANSPAYQDIEEIRAAAMRGADLTRQLLIFSRREVVRPEVVELNDLVGELQSLLRRALGERVELRTKLHSGLWRVRADRGQLEQVLVNLAVNGRDAMPDGGSLDVETTNVSITAEQSTQHADLDAGDYILIRVTDTGVGMSPEVMARAFEPFYTTKPKGEGTGLGLATVYGIVKEAGGRVALYSEPGFGTSVKVYLPATDAPVTNAALQRPAAPRARGETVLLVEDQDEVRRMAERILADAGYRVLEASDGDAALVLAAEHEIDIMLTDVIMPGMLGPELARRARVADPHLKVIFMSGYSDQVLADAVPDPHAGSAFIEKPFSADELLFKLRLTLDGLVDQPATHGLGDRGGTV